MTELLTAAQMRSIEKAAIDSGEVTGLELMERAGSGVVEAIFEEWPEWQMKPHRAAALCGPGNNGGDGFVVARLLKERGWEVEVFLYGDPEKLPPDARVNYERWAGSGKVIPLTEKAFRSSSLNQEGTLVLDAIFGTGLKRALSGDVYDLVRHLSGVNGDHYRDFLVSIDVPSGLCADSGFLLTPEKPSQIGAENEHSGRHVTRRLAFMTQLAALTVTFDSPKAGHFLGQGADICGKVVVKDIGIEAWRSTQYDSDHPIKARSLRSPKLRLCCKEALVTDRRATYVELPLNHLRKYTNQSHKYNHGHALVLAGGLGRTGAARLAARGALRVGAGLVTIGCPDSALAAVAAQTTAIMCRRLNDDADLSEALEDKRFNALCLGPGLGLGAATRQLALAALNADRAAVLDADALSAFADAQDTLFEALHERCVLTPHGGEFRRLFPDIADKLEASATSGPSYSKVDATREAAARAGCVVLFKGQDTVIAEPSGRCSINFSGYERAAPWLATAGSGDALAGFAAGLLARGFAPMQAAEIAAWLHTECALSFGPGLIAEDLPEELPAVFRELGL